MLYEVITILQWPVFGIYGHCIDFVGNAHSFGYFSKDGVGTVDVRCASNCFINPPLFRSEFIARFLGDIVELRIRVSTAGNNVELRTVGPAFAVTPVRLAGRADDTAFVVQSLNDMCRKRITRAFPSHHIVFAGVARIGGSALDSYNFV